MAIVLCAAQATTPAGAQRRVAFVVGNDIYDNLERERQLTTGASDARAVSRMLRELGFDVLQGENVRRREFNALWQRFLDTVQPGDIAIIHYSGHGVELKNVSYLLQRDIPGSGIGEVLLETEGIALHTLVFDLKRKHPSVSLVIVDACRDNPFVQRGTRSIGRDLGLAPIEPPEGTFVMYSAGIGEKSLDRLSRDDQSENSVYTRLLLPLLRTPGMDIREVSRRVRVSVRELAKQARPHPHVQTPAYYDQLLGPFCLVTPCRASAEPPPLEDFNPAGPSEMCRLGEPMPHDNDKFRIEFLVVEDGPEVRSIMSRQGNTNQGRALQEAVNAGTVKRASGVGTLTVGILGVSQKPFPTKIPYFLGSSRVCHGQMPVMGTPDGVEISIPIGSSQNRGQSGISVSRRHLAASRLQICVEASFPIHRRGLTESAYKNRENVRCGFLGDRPGTTSVGDALGRGARAFNLILVRRDDR